MNLLEKTKSGLGTLYSRGKANKLGTLKVILYAVLIVVTFFYVGRCAKDVTDVVDKTVKENPVLNVISTMVDKIPNPVRKIINKKKDPVVTPDADKNATEEEIEAARPRNFRTDIHLDAGVYTDVIPATKTFLLPKPGIGLSLFSYGPSKKENIFRFMRFGVGGWINSGLDITVAPIMYNLGHKIPIVTNTYIYPHFGYNATNNRFVAGLGMSLSF